MKKWKLAITLMILSLVLTSCKTVDNQSAKPWQPPAPFLVDTNGNSQVQLVQDSDIVIMRLEVWKRIVRYINETRPPSDEDKSQVEIKNPFITKDELSELLK